MNPDEFPTPKLTITQRRIWIAETVTGHTPAQVVTLQLDHSSQIPDVTRRAKRVISKMDIFRLQFVDLGSLVVQERQEDLRIKFQHVALPSTNLEAEIALAVNTLDRKAGPLIVLRFLNQGETAAVIVAAHSLVADPETIQMILRGMTGSDSGRDQEVPLRSFLDYALLEQSDPRKIYRAIERWRTALTKDVSGLRMPSGEKRKTIEPSFARRASAITVPQHQRRTIQSACAQRGWSFMGYLFATIIASVAKEYSSTSFVSCFTSSLRTRAKLMETPGHFSHFIPIVTHLESLDFSEIIEQVQECVLAAMSEPYLPLTDWGQLINHSSSKECGFQVLFTYLPENSSPPDNAFWRLIKTTDRTDAGFALHFVARDSARETQLFLDYDDRRVDEDRAESLSNRVGHYLHKSVQRQCNSFAPVAATKTERPETPNLLRRDCSSVQALVHDVWVDILGCAPESLEQSFFDAGGTSIMLPRLLDTLSKTIGRKTSLSDALRDPTIAGIAESLDSAVRLPLDNASEDETDLRASSQVMGRAFRSTARAAMVRSGRNLKARTSTVLLAGATGFLGRHLLARILKTTEWNVICIARCNHGLSADARVRSIPEIAGDDIEARVKVIEADLSDPWLLLPNNLECDLVINAAACVNFYFPCHALFDSNVNSLLPLIEIAGRTGARLAHVSTLGIFDFSLGRWLEDDLLSPDLPAAGGYPETKWIADVALRHVRSSEMRVDIFRPGWIYGSKSSGRINQRDLVWLLMDGILKIGAYPDMEFEVLGSPVESVVDGILDGAALAHDREGRSFNMPGTHRIPFSKMVRYLEMMGYSLQRLPPSDWHSRARVMSESDTGTVAALLAMMRPGEAMSGLQEWQADSTNATNFLGWPTGPQDMRFEDFRGYASNVATNELPKFGS